MGPTPFLSSLRRDLEWFKIPPEVEQVRTIANVGASKYIPRIIVLAPVQSSSICGGYYDRDRDDPNDKLRLPQYGVHSAVQSHITVRFHVTVKLSTSYFSLHPVPRTRTYSPQKDLLVCSSNP
jgi:hypothetical protein